MMVEFVKCCPHCGSKRLDKIYKTSRSGIANVEEIEDQCLECGCEGTFGSHYREEAK